MNHFFKFAEIVVDFCVFDVVYNILFIDCLVLIFALLTTRCSAGAFKKWVGFSSFEEKALAIFLLLWWITPSIAILCQLIGTFAAQKFVWLPGKLTHFFTDCNQGVYLHITRTLIMLICHLIFATPKCLFVGGASAIAVFHPRWDVAGLVGVTCCAKFSKVGDSFWVVVFFECFETVLHLAKHLFDSLFTVFTDIIFGLGVFQTWILLAHVDEAGSLLLLLKDVVLQFILVGDEWAIV